MSTAPLSQQRDGSNNTQASLDERQSVAELLDSRQQLREQLSHFSNVMLVTYGKEGTHELHARPMAIAKFDEESPLLTVWFVTHIDSSKVAEVRSEHGAYVIGQATGRFISVSGSVDVVRDTEKIEKLWSKAFDVWFPDGPKDPNVTLLAFYPEQAEVWDSTGLKGVRYMFEAAKALVTGEAIEQPSPSQDGHRKIDLRD